MNKLQTLNDLELLKSKPHSEQYKTQYDHYISFLKEVLRSEDGLEILNYFFSLYDKEAKALLYKDVLGVTNGK
jgi:hypothetical protein